MAHLLSVVNGQAEMVSGRNQTPWHKLGTIVSGLMTAQQALDLAHLNWNVKSGPVIVNGMELPFPNGETADCWQGIFREDTGAALGVMRGRYEIIQNAEAFGFFDNLIGQGKAVYDTAGALRGGKQVWLLAKVDGEIQINGDAHRQYALLVTSHDGSYSMQVSFVTERVVCANTLNIAVQGACNTVKIRHTANWKDKEAEAARVLNLGEHYFKTIQDRLAGMNEQLLSPFEMQEFSRLLVPANDETKVPTRTKNIRNEIAALFSSGDGNAGASRWDALNAVTDYADHAQTLRGNNSTRLESSTFGSGAALKQRAFDLLTDDDVMGRLLDKSFIPTPEMKPDADFARLLGQN